MSAIATKLTDLFDYLQEWWEARATRRVIARVLIGAFLVSIALIELSRLGIAETFLGFPMPEKHFYAISWVVTLLLIIEVLDLIFGLAGSVAGAIGKQLEIFSLVLLRKTFDQLPDFPEPIGVDGHVQALCEMAAQAGGALVVFVALIFFYRAQRHRPVSRVPSEVADFVRFKKLICLLLLVAFVAIGAVAGVQTLTLENRGGELPLHFFEYWFTVLIFADVVVVLASIGGTLGYSVVFRNFGFAIVTIFVRLALAAEPYINAILGVGAATFALAVSYAYSLAVPEVEQARETARDDPSA